MLSVRLASNVRNCLPFFVNPRTWEPEHTNIFSCGVPTAPPRSIRDIFGPGSVLKTGCWRHVHFIFCFWTVRHLVIWDTCGRLMVTNLVTHHCFPFLHPKAGQYAIMISNGNLKWGGNHLNYHDEHHDEHQSVECLMNRWYLLCCLFPQGWKEPHCFLGGHTNLFITARANQSQHHLKGGTRALNKYLKSVKNPSPKVSIHSACYLDVINSV